MTVTCKVIGLGSCGILHGGGHVGLPRLHVCCGLELIQCIRGRKEGRKEGRKDKRKERM